MEPLAYTGGAVAGTWTVGTALANVSVPAATGGSGTYTYTTTASTLPAGLTLNADGTITGVPTAAGNAATISVTVSDGTDNKTANVDLPAIVKGTPVVEVISPDTVDGSSGTVNYADCFTIKNANGDTLSAADVGGVTYGSGDAGTTNGTVDNSAGTVTGINAAGTISFEVTVTGNANYNSVAATTISVTVTVGDPVTVTGDPAVNVIEPYTTAAPTTVDDLTTVTADDLVGTLTVSDATTHAPVDGTWSFANLAETLQPGANTITLKWEPENPDYAKVTDQAVTVYVKKQLAVTDFELGGTKNKVYDGKADALSAMTLSLRAGSQVDTNTLSSLTYKLAYADASVGTNKDVSVSNVSFAASDYYIAPANGILTGQTGTDITPKAVTLVIQDATVNAGENQIVLDAVLDSPDFVGEEDTFSGVLALELGDTGYDGKLHWNATTHAFNEKADAMAPKVTGTLYMKDSDGTYAQVTDFSGFESGKEYYLDLAVTAMTQGNYAVNIMTAQGTPTDDTREDYAKLEVVSSGGGVSTRLTVKYDAGDHGILAEGAKKSESVRRNKYPENVPEVVANEGWKFLGWSQDGETVVDPATVKITKSVTFTALYEEIPSLHAPYVVGTEAGQFSPEASMSRAEAATMLARLHPDWKGAAGSASFTDMAEGAWFYETVTFAADKGIVEGRGEGVFAPDAIITRAELSAMLARYMGLETEGLSGGFSDTEGHWADAYITALKNAGVADGYEDGSFRPDNAITRAEAVKLINGAIGRSPNAELVAGHAAENPFGDVAESHWAFADILEAAVEHSVSDFHAAGQE